MTNIDNNIVSDFVEAVENKTTEHNNDASAHTNKADKNGGVQQVTDSNAHDHLGTSAGATQGTINTAINTKLGDITVFFNGSGE